MQQRSYSSESYNNFNYQMESSSLSAAPLVSSLPEPGQSFFDYLSPDDGVSNYSNASSTSQSFHPQSVKNCSKIFQFILCQILSHENHAQ